MDALKSAAEAVQRHMSTVLLYLIANAALGLCWNAIAFLQAPPEADAAADPTLAAHLLIIASFVFYSAAIAAVQTLVFSRVGREIDRPLWKVRDDREAFQRFYMMWFEFNLALNALMWMANTRLGNDATLVINMMALLVVFALAIVIVPFGTCQMFLGSFSWGTFGEALGPIARKPGEFVPVFGVALFTLVFGQYASYLTQTDSREVSAFALMAGSRVACDVALGYLDCLVFAAAWTVCKLDRDSPDELDLDF